MAEERFGPYLLCGLLGRGGMGEVHRAVDLVKQRQVAVKRLPAVLAADRDFQQRFRLESELAARLRDPHVVPIHHFGEIDGKLFVEMRLVEGGDLGDRLRAGPLPPAEAVAIVTQVASALDAAHAAGLVHRDVKPSNVLLDGNGGAVRGGFAYLGDFGSARSLSGPTSPTVGGGMLGTLAYMAPERFAADGDHRADVYSLACVLHEALTGEPPFGRDGLARLMYAHLHRPPPRVSDRVDVPPGLDEVVARGLAKDPAARYASAGELAAAARAALAPPRPGRTLVAPDRHPPNGAVTWDEARVAGRIGRLGLVLLSLLTGAGMFAVLAAMSYVPRLLGAQSGSAWHTVGMCAAGGVAFGLLMGLVVGSIERRALRLPLPVLRPGEQAVLRGFATTAGRAAPRRGCLYLTTERLVFHDSRPGTHHEQRMDLPLMLVASVDPGRRRFLIGPMRELGLDTALGRFGYLVGARATWTAAIDRARRAVGR